MLFLSVLLSLLSHLNFQIVEQEHSHHHADNPAADVRGVRGGLE
jgi:hypothetical protein